MNRFLSDKNIEDYLNTLNDSEDGAESSENEEDDESFYRNNLELLRDLEGDADHETNANVPLLNEGDALVLENIDPPLLDEDITAIIDMDPPLENDQDAAGSQPSSNRSHNFRPRRVLWRQMNRTTDHLSLDFPEIQYPDSLLDLQTPYHFFSYFITEELKTRIVDESNIYATQKNLSNPFNITKTDLNHFLGILIYSSIVHFPNFRLYWSEKYGYLPIKNTMSLKTFEKISSVLHFNNNGTNLPQNHPQHDRLHRIRPVITELNERFSTIPLEQRLSIDEQMCATKIGHYMKQYLPNKPHKWGFKLFIICSIYGFAHKFEIYAGNARHIPNGDEPDLGATGNTVIRLSRIVPRRANHIIYFDNYYTSVPLALYLAKQGIYCLGTIQANRIPNNKLPDKKTVMKRDVPRGFYVENVANVDGVEMSVIVWKDNKPVTFLSTYTGALPVTDIQRYDKVQKTRIPIPCPHIIKDYNSHMGGVDLLDSFIGRYHITRKSRKWTNRLFFHLLDVAIINSWLMYKKTFKKTKPNEKIMNLCYYRLDLAETLCNLGAVSMLKRGRPSTSSLEYQLQQKKKRGPAQTMPPRDVRQDRVDHWQHIGERTRCKFPNCKGYTQHYCVKCRVFLCYNKENNCFYKFHNE